MLKTALEAAHIAGDILKQGLGTLTKDQIQLKAQGEFLSESDLKAEKAVIECIRKVYPDHRIYAEESGKTVGDSPYQWVIDPLDGTTNYVKSIPHYSVSIALAYEDKPIVAVVYDPEHEELFQAEKGKGSFLNGNRLQVREPDEMTRTVLSTGFPYRSHTYIDEYMDVFKKILVKTAGIRRLGSAALDLSYIASGRFEGFWELLLKPYDFLAGVLILQEAGGVVTDFRGEERYLQSGNIVAGTPSVHAMILEETKKTLSHIE